MKPDYESPGINLYYGDCMDILPALAKEGINAVITDPPYNVGLDYSGGDNRDDYVEWCSGWFEELKSVCDGPIAISCGIGNLTKWHLIKEPSWIMAWVKRNSTKRVATGWNTWEPVLLYGKIRGKKTHDSFLVGMAKQKDTGNHPCPKPKGWASELIDRLTLSEDIVLDPFMGSGTTAIMCVKSERKFIGIEIEQEYFDIAVERIEEAQQQASLL
jgi:DNA modification methylase